MQEIETKVLEVDALEIIKKIESLGAEKTGDSLLKVDWFSLPGIDKDNQPWYLRIRSYNDEKVEITWKDEPKLINNLRKGNEINVLVDNHAKMKLFFESIGLVCYAHQEKKRQSFKLGAIQFDLDTYPGMPSFLEIEVQDEKDINTMIEKLNLETHETWNDGERKLIENKYNLNWSSMHFT